ncbi:hypothetical protein JTB14_004762 [Gonioctena quinquepunctata]|nr:hypothetical protein JTB14_004762 [Gonioctena quinquepunctata]
MFQTSLQYPDNPILKDRPRCLGIQLARTRLLPNQAAHKATNALEQKATRQQTREKDSTEARKCPRSEGNTPPPSFLFDKNAIVNTGLPEFQMEPESHKKLMPGHLIITCADEASVKCLREEDAASLLALEEHDILKPHTCTASVQDEEG